MDLLATLKDDFIEGAVKNGENRSELEHFWDEMNEFGRYRIQCKPFIFLLFYLLPDGLPEG